MAMVPKMPKVTGKMFAAIVVAVLNLQKTGLLRYTAGGKVIQKLQADLPKLPGDESKPDSGRIIQTLWQAIVDKKSAPGKWAVTIDKVRQRVKAMAKLWEESHMVLPVAVDAPDGTEPQIVRVVVKNGVSYYRAEKGKEPIAVPEGTLQATYPEIFGLELETAEIDPFEDMTELEDTDFGDIDFGS